MKTDTARMKTDTSDPTNAAANLSAAREALALAEANAARAVESSKRQELEAIERDRSAFVRDFEREAVPLLLRFVDAARAMDVTVRDLGAVIRRSEERGRGIFARMIRAGMVEKNAHIPGTLVTHASPWGLGCAVLHALGRHEPGSVLARLANPDGVQTAPERAAVNAAAEALRRVQ